MKRTCLLSVLLALVLLTGGCSSIEQLAGSAKRCDSLFAEFTDKLLAGDADGCYALMYQDGFDRDAFGGGFAEMSKYVAGRTEYSYVRQSLRVSINSKQLVADAEYRLEFNDGYKLIALFQYINDGNGAEGVSLYQFASMDQPVIRNGSEEVKKTPWSAAFVLEGILCAAFSVWMFIDCLRHKMKDKWMWVLLTLLGTLTVIASFSSGSFNWSFNALFTRFARLTLYEHGGFYACLNIPVGAIVYCAARKKLIIKDAPTWAGTRDTSILPPQQ